MAAIHVALGLSTGDCLWFDRECGGFGAEVVCWLIPVIAYRVVVERMSNGCRNQPMLTLSCGSIR